MLRELTNWLGPGRTRLLVGAFIGTAGLNLALQLVFFGESWVLTVQLALAWLLLVIMAVVLHSRLPHQSRRRLWLVLGPGLALLGLGVLMPGGALFLGGAGLGWMVVVQLVLRSRVRMEYQEAIRYLHQNEVGEAVAVMDRLIEAENSDPDHYVFRAKLFRLSAQLDRARADYERVIALEPDSSAGYTGLAEVCAQQGDFAAARGYALQALERDPDHWVPAYNLGMIEDRLGHPQAAVAALERGLRAGMPGSRFRLMSHFWLARSHYRLGDTEAARHQLELMRKQAAGMREWVMVLESEQAASLRGLLESDVRLAGRLIEDDAALESLGSSQVDG
ncbi:MAG: tetratricopeptide repeat protein [Anaerolineae bacterium]|nr:tetratricopeptide repeat protein [Anaerolineae bacterium]